MAQGDVANAKDDTRFYSTSVGGLEVDLSQQADDLTVGTAPALYESGAQSRWDVGAPACWELDVDFDNADTGYLYTYEPAGSTGVRLELRAGGLIDACVNGSVVATATAPNISATTEQFIISWSMENNPLTTGAGDAVRSELRVWNNDDTGYTQVVVTHASVASGSATVVWLARNTTGGAGFTGTANELRFGAGRFHPASEAREDFIANTTAPTLTLETRKEVPVPTRDSGVGAHDNFAGPIYMAVAAALAQTDLRLAGRILSEHYRDQPDQDESFPAARTLAVPDATSYTLLGQYLAYRPIPVTCNRLKVRVQIQAWRVDANPADNILIRVYSMNRPPTPLANLGGAPAWNRTFQSLTVNADHGSGTTGGAWFTFGLLTITRTPNGQGSWLGLAFDVTDAGGLGSTADQRWRVRSWTIEPGLVVNNGELPLG